MYINNSGNRKLGFKIKYFSSSEDPLLRIICVLLLYICIAPIYPSVMDAFMRNVARPFSVLSKYACTRTGGDATRAKPWAWNAWSISERYSGNITDWPSVLDARGSLASIDSEDRGQHKALYAHIIRGPNVLPASRALFRIPNH